MTRSAAVWLCALAALAAGAPTAGAGPTDRRCSGEQITISYLDPGVGKRIVGTPGRDVILGGPDKETILAGGGEDTVCAGGDDDTLDGGPGRDELYGEEGSDVFTAAGSELAEDLLVGGPGSSDFDIANYGSSSGGVRVNLTTGIVRTPGLPAGGVQGIETVAGSRHDDQLIGTPRGQRLFGQAGDDAVHGRGGGDILTGGSGLDRLTYASSEAGVRIDVDRETVTIGRGGGSDLFAAFEIFEGSRHDDRIVGGDGRDFLIGGAGDDVLKGQDDDDVLDGGPGDDTLFPGGGDDAVVGGDNAPVRSTGAPGDLVSYVDDALDKGVTSFELFLTTDPRTGTPPVAQGVGEDTLTGIESARGPASSPVYLEGDAGPNVLIGGRRGDVLDGGDGNDLLFGLAGEDTLQGRAGDDFLDGGGPTGDGDADSGDGGDGQDTCLAISELFRVDCEEP